MRKTSVLLAWVGLSTISSCAVNAAVVGPLVIYVATDGNDSHTGTSVATPLLTCRGALKRIEALASDMILPLGGVEVRIAPGVYPYTNANACCMAASCGGTPITGTQQSPLVIRGTGAGEVTFDGSVLIDASLLRPVINATVKKILNPAAKDAVQAMPLATAPSVLYWDNVPLTPSIWPNKGLAYIQHVADKGAVYVPGRTKGQPPPYSMMQPIGANFTLAEVPTGDWATELATPGFGVPRLTGYLAVDWYEESHRVARVAMAGNGANASISVKLEEYSRYGVCEAIDGGCGGSAPGRFTVSGLLSELDVPGEWWYDGHEQILYVYPPAPPSLRSPDAASLPPSFSGATGFASTRLGTPHAGPFVTMNDTSYVTVRDITMTGSVGTLVTITGGEHNTVGGCTLKNAAGGASLSGGHYNTIIGNDIYDVGGHVSSEGDSSTTYQNLEPTNNLIANNHITNVHHTGAWRVVVRGQGDRFTHNLVHDAPGQVILPGGPLTMLDGNEVFNTGFVEGDGGVMYMGASLTSGYGMSFRENFLHHSLEIPGLHGRGGIYFDYLQAGVSNTSGNVMYKAAGRSFLVNGGAANNITRNLIVNGGEGIYNTNAMAKAVIAGLPLYDNGTLKRGDSGDFIWRAEQALGVKSYKEMFRTPLAARFPTFADILSVNSSTSGWASPARSNFQGNIFLNNSGGNICLLTSYHTPAVCDEKLAGDSALSQYVDMTGSHEGTWLSFPGASELEFVNAQLGFDTGRMGLVCDGWRRKMPPKSAYRPWVKHAFDGIPSVASGDYTPEAAAARAGVRSGQHLVLQLNAACPPVTKTACTGYWLSWGECGSDRQKVERWTVDQWPVGGGAVCTTEDGTTRTVTC